MPSPVKKKSASRKTSVRSASPAERRRRKPKIGRPSLADVGLVDQAILEVAARVFLTKGYADASMDAVAMGARVSKRTLYTRYRNKDALFHAVVDSRLQAWSAEASQTNAIAGDTLEERLRFFLANMVRWGLTAEVRAYDRLLSTAPAATGGKLFELQYTTMLGKLTAEIERLSREEGRPARNPRSVAFDLMALIVGWFRFRAYAESPSEAEGTAFANHAVDLLFATRRSW